MAGKYKPGTVSTPKAPAKGPGKRVPPKPGFKPGEVATPKN